jgi:hypothetical protein
MNAEKCDRCGTLYITEPFASMLANGERADSEIEIGGDKYKLCPTCTNKIYMFLQHSTELK